jgi:D-alanyl-D-alanine carboxypeptidase
MAAPFAAIVMDARSGEVLWEKNADSRLHPASLTKMMTLYITFQEIEAGRISLDDKVTVSKNAAAEPPSRLGLKAGQKIALRYLIRAAAIKSANDAATAIGEHIAGSEEAFAKRMTKTAKALGMKSTTFKSAHGLTRDGHLSTARDMTVLGRHLFYDFPQYYNIFSRRTEDAGIAKVTNTNSRFLDGYEGADGIKTGYTAAAGFNLTASAKRGNKRIIATIFGATSTAARNAKMAELMDMGFGMAKRNVKERKPDAAPIPEDALIASAEPGPIDTPDVAGGAAKTIRVSGEVTRSLRPKARPALPGEVMLAAAAPAEPVPEVPDALALAIAEGVDAALAEATAPPPPEGTLEAQALALETSPQPVLRPETVAEPVDVAAVAPEGTLEAQAAALAEAPAVVAAAPEGTLEAQAAMLAEAPAAIADPALAAVRPMARPAAEVAPEAVAVAEAAAPVEEVIVAEAAPVVEDTMAEAPLSLTADAGTVAAGDDLAAVTAVETVAAVTPAAILPMTAEEPARAAPIFEPVQVADATPEEEEALTVVSKSTSGGHHWGVNVGAYTSRGEAERALLKMSLAESATLSEGLKKVTEKSGKYRASFLGLSADQADLACRRLHARGMACETIGPA